MTPEGAPLSREELLGGLPARPASLLLFAIQSRTARRVAQAEQTPALYLTEAGGGEQESTFLEALAAGRAAPARPSIQDLERHAPDWAALLPGPEDSGVRAALAHLLAGQYRFTTAAVPRLRAALALDSPPVRAAYQRLYGAPLDTIYVPRAAPAERLHWAWSRLAARLEALPPFWIAFALTLPVGPGLLALPIALAEVGPLPGVVLLVLFGLLNAVTVAALAEAVACSGVTRYGVGYLGQLVADYLGGAGALLLTLVLAANNVLALLVFYIGVADTLAGTTGIPRTVWIAALFAVGLYFLSRKSLRSTVASALVVVAINLTLLVILPLLALPRVQPSNLTTFRLPLVGGAPFEPGTLRLVFGVLLSNYFSHLLVANYGRVVLQRDPSARAWMRGGVAAIGATTLVSCLWVVLVNGALGPAALTGQTGTVLAPLAARVGTVANVLGSIFVVLSLGMATIHISLGMLFLVAERLPAHGGLGARGRFLLASSPVIAVFLVAEWLALSGSGSFAGLLGFLGVISLPLLGGIFPVLLLAASRRKGDLALAAPSGLLGSPPLLVGVYLLFLASIVVHGLFIWPTALERALTLLTALLVIGATVQMLRQGAFGARMVVELRADERPGGQASFSVLERGHPTPAAVRLDYPSGSRRLTAASGTVPAFASLRAAELALAPDAARALKLWAHRLTPEGGSVPLPARVEVHCTGVRHALPLAPPAGQAVIPLTGGPCTARIELADAPTED